MRTAIFLVTASLLALSGCSTTNPTVVTRLNTDAVLSGAIPVDPLNWRVVTSGVSRENSTMFTVFANDVAVEYVRTNSGFNYPAGSAVALATWHQQDDDRWFGAKIPARVVSVELVDVERAANEKPSPRYRAYEGSPLKEKESSQSQAEQRVGYILSLRAAVMP